MSKEYKNMMSEEGLVALREVGRKRGKMNIGHRHTEEQKKNISEGMKRYWNKRHNEEFDKLFFNPNNVFTITDEEHRYKVSVDIFKKVMTGELDFRTYDKSQLEFVR